MLKYIDSFLTKTNSKEMRYLCISVNHYKNPGYATGIARVNCHKSLIITKNTALI